MTWEPKQGELVIDELCKNDSIKKKQAVFVCMYKYRYVLDDEGYYFWVSSIERLVIEKEPEITVGSVWERDKKLWVLTHISKDDLKVSFWCPDSSEYYPCAPIKNFKPRPDKIGMAPCAIKWTSHMGWSITDSIFPSLQVAETAHNKNNFNGLIWPANNSLWVIVDKE